MEAVPAERGVAHKVVKVAVAVTACLAVFALDLLVANSFWPAVLYVVALSAISWLRGTPTLAASSAVAVAGVTAAGLLNADSVADGQAGAEWAGRITLSVVIALVVAARIVRGDGVAAEAPTSSSGTATVAREFSDRAALHAAEANALESMSAEAREAFRLAAEDYAQRLERRMDRLLEVLPIVIWTARSDGEIDFFNHVFVRYTGMSVEELKGQGWISTVHPDDLAEAFEQWAASMASGDPYSSEFRMRSASGEYRWFQNTALAEKDDDGTVLRWWGASIDVHDARSLEAEARTLAEDRERILQSIGDGVSEVDTEWRFSYVSPRGAALVQRTSAELEGLTMWEAFPEMVGTNMEQEYRTAVETGNATQFETFNPVLERWFDVYATPTAHGLTLFYRDVTETRALQDSLSKAQRLEAVGQLTGGVAHDFNNLLTVVVGGAEALEDSEHLSQADREMVALIGDAAHRGAELTSMLLAFARRMPLSPSAADLNVVIAGLKPLLTRTIGENVRIRFDLAPDLPAAQVDTVQFESALLNLAINARDAMPDGGNLVVETRVAEVDEQYAAHDTVLEPGSYVITAVSDTGMGIPAENLDRLFEPFFTTKPAGMGTGMGLPTIWGFAKQSGGHVTVYSEAGVGTTFKLYLPVSDATVATSTAPSPGAADARGTGRILMVEDDPLVREFAAAQLAKRGYDVTIATDGPDALERLDELGEIDLLFTDVIMPGGMTGKDLAAAVAAKQPGVPVLFTSGHAQDVIVHDGRLDENVTLLPKPYSARELAVAIAGLLGSPGGAS